MPVKLNYIVEARTIARLLGEENFTSDEAAVLELVKNAYDAGAKALDLIFDENSLIIIDNGKGMNADDIRENWMHIGKSNKNYEMVDDENNTRILAGSKGIGRFALSRLGGKIRLISKKKGSEALIWTTDWNESLLDEYCEKRDIGTEIQIYDLHKKWSKRKIQSLREYLSVTYNDDIMSIYIKNGKEVEQVTNAFPKIQLGINCLSKILVEFDSQKREITTTIISDEFQNEAKIYCSDIDLNFYKVITNAMKEFSKSSEIDLSDDELFETLFELGDFKAEFYFNVDSSVVEQEKFLYKYLVLPEKIRQNIVLYRNAFSISTYEGKKDWLGLGMRSRKSPAAASHVSGSWRVRENQLSGKVEIDKKENKFLIDLSNRQGLDENIYFKLFTSILLVGISDFERYRQSIIRKIDIKNKEEPKKNDSVSTLILEKKVSFSELTKQQSKELINELKESKKDKEKFVKNSEEIENKYKYDVRILNVLATTGLKASSIAHELKNDRNLLSDATVNIIESLKEYKLWDDLNSPEKTRVSYRNVPYLITANDKINKKILVFMETMLSDTEKQKFKKKKIKIFEVLKFIKMTWERDYSWISVKIIGEEMTLSTSEDVLEVIFDNLILNSIQQNSENTRLEIKIEFYLSDGKLQFEYSDNGKGLDEKYHSNPKRILEVHESTRVDGHGLGMWIIHNTIIMSKGEVVDIGLPEGFKFIFNIGG